MTRRLLQLLLLLVTVVPLAPAPAAAADPVSEIVRSLRSDPVHVDPTARLAVDTSSLRAAVDRAAVPFYVAVVPDATAERNGGLARLVVQLGTGIQDSGAVVLVVTDARRLRADNGRAAADDGVDAGSALESVLSGRGGTLDAAALTGVVTDLVNRVNDQARAGGASAGTPRSSGGGLLGPLLLVGLLVGGAWLLLGSRRRRKEAGRELEDRRADVESLYGRLGSDVQLLSPGDDPVAKQALADAAERYNATGALLATADSPGELAAARRTAIEGITAARVVRRRLGLDAGPDVPALPAGSAPALTEPASVQVGDEQYDGSPDYEPGRPHYFEGGYLGGTVVPGGWYATPFWQTLLLGGLMGGGFGGYGGYGRRRGGVVWGGGLSGFGGLGGRGRGGRRGGGFGGFGGSGGGGTWGGGGGGGRRGGSW